MNVYKRYLKYLFKYKLNLTCGIILGLISAAVSISPIFIIQYFVKSAFEQKNYNNLITSVLFGLAAIILIFLFTYLSKYIMEFLSKKVIYTIRNKLFNNLMYLPMKYFKDEKSGNIISISTNDISELQFFTANSVLNLVKEPIVIILVIVKMFLLNFQLTAFILILSPVFVGLIHLLSNKVKSIEVKIREKLSNLTSFIHQAIYGIQVIKVFAMEKKEIHRFNEENTNYLNHDKKILRYTNLARPMVDFIGGLGVLFLLAYGGYKVIKGQILTSELTALIVALTTLSLPIKNLSETLIHIKKTSASLTRIFKTIDEESEEHKQKGKIKIDDVKGEVKFENVSFAYGKDEVLTDIDFNVKKGQIIAFVGHSGAGKTTLVNLIPRLIIPAKGKILIDNNDIMELDLNCLRKQISVVTQENIVFNGTILENIAYGKPGATIKEIEEAAQIANCLDFIKEMPDNFNTIVGDRGVKLSGGQCQRITLARAVLRKPAILILDEATSSLDSESEKLIQDALNKIIKNQTTFIISHRLSTISHADVIYVLEKGKITQKGNHEELLNKGGIYKKLYDLQFDI